MWLKKMGSLWRRKWDSKDWVFWAILYFNVSMDLEKERDGLGRFRKKNLYMLEHLMGLSFIGMFSEKIVSRLFLVFK